MSHPYRLQVVEDCLACRLRSEHFFCGLPAPVLAAFNQLKYPISYPPGALLFVEGQTPRGIYMLCQGRVKLCMDSHDGRTLILKIVLPGDVLGLHSCVSGLPYQMTAETVLPTQADFVKRDDFLRFLREHGEACLQAAQHLSNSCQSALDLIRSLGLSHSAREKLARFFLELSRDAEETQDGIRVKLGLTHEEIAQTIGTSRETVTRSLAEFRERHVVVLQGSTLLIQNKGALERLVGAPPRRSPEPAELSCAEPA